MKWTEAYRFSSSKENAHYTKCCESDVHCDVWQWWCNTAPLCTSKAVGKRCLLLHISAAPPSSSAQEKTTTLVNTEPYHSSWQYKESNRYCCHGPLEPLAMGDSGTSTVLARYESMRLRSLCVEPGGPMVVILAIGSKVRGFKPGRGRWIFSKRKNPEYDFLRKGSKAVGPVK